MKELKKIQINLKHFKRSTRYDCSFKSIVVFDENFFKSAASSKVAIQKFKRNLLKEKTTPSTVVLNQFYFESSIKNWPQAIWASVIFYMIDSY